MLFRSAERLRGGENTDVSARDVRVGHGVFLIRLSGRKYYTHEYIFSYMDMRCSRTIASRSILGSPGGSSTVQGQCEQVLFHLDQLLHAFLNTGEMALDSLP